jgi:hypothetical protein
MTRRKEIVALFEELYLQNVPSFSSSHYLFSFFLLDRMIAQNFPIDQNTVLGLISLTLSLASYDVQFEEAIASSTLEIFSTWESKLFSISWNEIFEQNFEIFACKFDYSSSSKYCRDLASQRQEIKICLEMILSHYWLHYPLFWNSSNKNSGEELSKNESCRAKISTLILATLNNLLRIYSNLEIRDDYFVFTTWFFSSSTLQKFFFSDLRFSQHLKWHSKYRRNESFRSLGPFIAIPRRKGSESSN